MKVMPTLPSPAVAIPKVAAPMRPMTAPTTAPSVTGLMRLIRGK